MRSHISFVPAILAAIAASACTGGPSGAPPTTVIEAPARPRPPVKIVVLGDESGSGPRNRAEPVTVAHLDPIVALLKERSGQLAVGVIRESSETLVRLDVSRLPVAPTREPAGNVFDADDGRARFERALAAHHAAVQSWNETFKAHWAAFAGDLNRLLVNDAAARHSAVWEAIRRADAALAEPEVGPPSAGHRYIILASDAEDTTSAARPTLD